MGLRKRATGISDGVSLQSGLSGGLVGLRKRATGMSDGVSLQSGALAVCISSRGGCGAVGMNVPILETEKLHDEMTDAII